MEQRTHKCLVSPEVLSSGNFRLPGVGCAVDRQHNRGGSSEQRSGGGGGGGGQVLNLVVHGNQAASDRCL